MIPFNDLGPLHRSLAPEIRAAVDRVIDRSCYILGPEVEAFESEFANWQGRKFAVGVANGTDAIELALRALGIGPGDEVVTTAHTAVATVCAVERAGARPVMVDIDPVSYTMLPSAAAAAITPSTKAILPVHLYGHPADIGRLQQIADRHNLALIEDCAQAHGARYGNQHVGNFGTVAAFSFYPTKNLGALGDGGAVVTDDLKIYERLKRLRNYGQTERYHHRESGINSRLDEMQAAVLRVKLPHLDEHNRFRMAIAAMYSNRLLGVDVPKVCRWENAVTHAFHLYVIRHPQRGAVQDELKRFGINTLIHYPVPVHLQDAYQHLGYRPGSLPNTEAVAREILSLPLYVGLNVEQIGRVVATVNDFTQRYRHAKAA